MSRDPPRPKEGNHGLRASGTLRPAGEQGRTGHDELRRLQTDHIDADRAAPFEVIRQAMERLVAEDGADGLPL